MDEPKPRERFTRRDAVAVFHALVTFPLVSVLGAWLVMLAGVNQPGAALVIFWLVVALGWMLSREAQKPPPPPPF